MRSPLAPETVLQSRYRLLKLMAEGGFAQTYLAEDRGRFGERCVIKEFCPNSNDARVFEKAQELFQREAQTLYKLEHPQIPNFRALFAESIDREKRLFLVQDYVEGQTYRAVLRQRSQEGKLFSEAEIRQLLHQLLPVLSYIHGLGLIHRDLSLENLILRTADRTPVLIDFGVVKTVVTQLQQTRVMPSGTAVGKFGFAPIEQLQSGRAYPSSDLYSLAVCCLVLLTGREPTELFDDVTAAWNWKPYAATVTPELAAIFDRMLAHKPSDRYSSATEVLQSLQTFSPVLSASAPLSPPPAPSPDLSQVRTIAVDSPELIRAPQPREQKPFIPPVYTPKAIATSSQRSPKQGTFILTVLATALLSAGAGWLAIQLLTQRPWIKETPVVSPSPIALPQSPKPSPTIRYSESLTLVLGQSVTVQGNLQPGEAQTYRFEGTAGDALSAQLNGSGVSFSLLRSDLSPLNGESQGITDWQGSLPQSGTYFVKVQNDPGNTVRSFQLALALAKPAPPQPSITPTPSASLSPSPIAPVIDAAILNLGPEAPIQRLSGELAPGHVRRYAVSVRAGQVLSAAVVDDKAVTLTVLSPEGQPLGSAQNVLNWQSLISEAGTYQVDVVPLDGTVPTSFAVEIGLQQP